MSLTARDTNTRYGTVAMSLHWLIAIAVIFNIWLGFYMGDLPRTDPDRFWFIQFHKSTGLSILVLSVARVMWRVINPMPALPETMAGWERILARSVHYIFYVLIIAIPLAGWTMVSSSTRGLPTMWYGLFPWPNIPFLAELSLDQKKYFGGIFEGTHNTLAIVALALIALHVAAALKHQFWDRDTVLSRMLPFSKAQ